VGLDVRQATTIASVRDTSGRVIARSILPTESAALVEFFQGVRGTVRVAFDARPPGTCTSSRVHT
jgi:hypothetical protein